MRAFHRTYKRKEELLGGDGGLYEGVKEEVVRSDEVEGKVERGQNISLQPDHFRGGKGVQGKIREGYCSGPDGIVTARRERGVCIQLGSKKQRRRTQALQLIWREICGGKKLVDDCKLE